MNDGPNDVSATQRSVLNSSLNSATTKRSNRYPHGVTSSSLPSDDTEQTPENAEYLGSNCVLLTYFSGDIDSHVDEHFSRALAHLQQQQQQQKVICPASNAGAVHHSSSSLSGQLFWPMKIVQCYVMIFVSATVCAMVVPVQGLDKG